VLRRSRSVWAPQMVTSTSRDDVDLDGEVDAIVKLLREKGPLSAAQIRTELETRLWGPGRLRAAMAEARHRGVVRRAGRRVYEAADSGRFTRP
jgi:winged helix DNA-binding protein